MSDRKDFFPDQSFEDLKRAAQEARDLAEMKSDFLAMVSHEIRTRCKRFTGCWS